MNPRVLLVSALGALLLGCAPNAVSLQFDGICAAPDAKLCTVTDPCTTFALPPVLVDPAVSKGVTLYAEMTNQLPINLDVSTGQGNTHDAVVDEMTVTYEPAIAAAATMTVGQRVPAASTHAISITPFTATTLAGLAGVTADVTAKIVLRGTWGDGWSKFELAPFAIPFKLIAGGWKTPLCTTGSPSYCPPDGAGQSVSTYICK